MTSRGGAGVRMRRHSWPGRNHQSVYPSEVHRSQFQPGGGPHKFPPQNGAQKLFPFAELLFTVNPPSELMPPVIVNVPLEGYPGGGTKSTTSHFHHALPVIDIPAFRKDSEKILGDGYDGIAALEQPSFQPMIIASDRDV